DGIHVLAPIQRRAGFDDTYAFAEAVSRLLEHRHPGLVTTEWLKKKRTGVLVDHRQNGWGKTIASVYSVRPKPGAPVSTPLRWQELTSGVRPGDFTMAVALERVQAHGDLFAPVLEDDARGASGVDDEAPRRRTGARQRRPAAPGLPRDRGRLRQGRRRQVLADGEPRSCVLAVGPAHGDSRRGHLRPLDSAHPRDPPEARRRRPDDRPAREGSAEADVDRLLPRRQRAGHVARADAAPRARAVPD